MNFIIRIILIAILIITIINECKGDDSYDKLRLADLFNKLKEEKNSKFELPDENCVKNYFNLPQNEKMIINPIEIIVMITAATLKCLEDSQVFNLYYDILANEQKSNLICFKHYLVKYELDSKFIENFVISDDEIKRCEKEVPLDKFEEMSFKIERIAGSVDDLTCRSVAGINEILKLAGRVADITLGNYSDEFKEIETKKTKQLIKEVVMTTAECLMKRFENDPKAFHINDTLNYYYIESLKPFTPPKNKNTSIYYENLYKLESNFDQECIKEKLNLPDNGQKVLLKIEAMTIITSAKLKCIKIEKSKFFEEFLKFSVEDDQKTEDKIACAKYGLRNRGINTKLSQTSIDYDYDKICNENYIYINLYVDFFLNLRESNEKLEESTCGVYDDDDRDKLYFTTLLLAVEKDEDLRQSEIERFSTLMIAKLQKLADCFLGRT